MKPEPSEFRRVDTHHAEAGAADAAAHPSSLAALLGTHVLREGEVVLLVLKPSTWFIFFNSAWFAGVTAVIFLALAEFDHRMHDRVYSELAALFIGARLMWASLQWMGRLYILTDQRVLRIKGVMRVEVFDCPLRRVVRTRLVTPLRERLVLVGSIEIIPSDETMPIAIWRTINRPREVHERVVAAINRARQSGSGS